MSDNIPVRPSVPDIAAIKAWLEYEYAGLIRDAGDYRTALVALAEKYPQGFPDDDVDGIAGQNLANLAAVLKDADERRLEESLAFRNGQKTINDWFKDYIVTPVTAASEAVQKRHNAYGYAKQKAAEKAAAEVARLAREAAERAAAEAAATVRQGGAEAIGAMEQAARAAADLAKAETKAENVTARVRGPQGSVSSATVTWSWEIADFSAVPDYYKTIDEAKIRDAARERGKGGRPTAKIPGIRWVEKFSMRNR